MLAPQEGEVIDLFPHEVPTAPKTKLFETAPRIKNGCAAGTDNSICASLSGSEFL
jgi:hypothetical protein